jgi:glycosyltransferase involved in cell wall biosynthesis
MLEVALAGDGTYLEPMKQLARRLGLAGHARFVGALPPAEAVYRFLDETDLFVLPSRPEGLPRAMIEAMARGCPCIGSTVGGIPELLPAEDLVPPGDVDALARKIVEVLSDPQRMQRMATRNWKAATEYLPEVLDERRRVFYRKTRELAEQSGRLARQSS